MRKLYFLDLGRNQLTGELGDRFFASANKLRHLHIDNNMFSGELQEDYFNGGGPGDGLLVFTAHNNMFTGAVPTIGTDNFGK
jgi:hypothetical protein